MPLVSLISDQEEQMRELGISVTVLKGGGPRDQQLSEFYRIVHFRSQRSSLLPGDSTVHEDSYSMLAGAEVITIDMIINYA